MADNENLVDQLNSALQIYQAFDQADRSLQQLKVEHNKQPFSQKTLQQRVASIARDLEASITHHQSYFNQTPQTQELLKAMINNIHSFQRYLVKKTYAEIDPFSPAL